MSLDIRQFPCLSDNYGFIIRDLTSGRTACIDTPDAGAVLAALDVAGWGLDFILNTHWHPDHAGGNAAVKAATGAVIVGPAEVTKIASTYTKLEGSQASAMIRLLETIEDLDDTQNVYSNFDFDEASLA